MREEQFVDRVNQATGLVVASGTANVGVTDTGHTHTVGTTQILSSYVIGFHETFGHINPDNRTLGTIAQSAAVETLVPPAGQTGHLRTMNVVFTAAWAGGTITINGIGALGQAVAEVYTKPVGGGTVQGTKSFAQVTNYVNSAPVAGAPVATITNDAVLGVSNFPVKEFIKVVFDGAPGTFSTTDLVNGTFDTTASHTGNHTLEVWYTVDVAPILADHTHTLTTNTTGVTVADSGHTHGLV